MTEPTSPSPAEIRASIRHLLPHGSFDLTVVRGQGIPGVNSTTRDGRDALVIRCRCGRRLDWPTGVGDTLPMDILLWWLIDHDDEMFLTPRELEAKWGAKLSSPVVALDPFGRPLVFDPFGALGLPPLPATDQQAAHAAPQRAADGLSAAPATNESRQDRSEAQKAPERPASKHPHEITPGDVIRSGGTWFTVTAIDTHGDWFRFTDATGATSDWTSDETVPVQQTDAEQ